MNIIARTMGHFRMIKKHRLLVCNLCFKCGLYYQGLTHDLSKYSPIEFLNGVRFYTGTCSPHAGERKKYGYSRAWNHHKTLNKHHVEYWRDIAQNSTMPNRYFVEMVCDRLAACMIYNKGSYDDLESILYRIQRKDMTHFHQDSHKLLEYWITVIHKHGAEASFDYIKHFLKNDNSLK